MNTGFPTKVQSENFRIPKLRFSEFEGEWEYANLGNCAHSFEYGMNASAIKFDGENRYIRITDIDESSSKYKPEFPVSPNGQLLDKYLVSENDILFARTGASTGKSYLYHKDDGKLYFAGFLIRAKIKEEYNSYFVFAQTKTVQYYKWVQLMSMRSGQPGINSQEYASYSFNIPSKNEQDKIASFFELLDERILTQKKIIEDLIILKSSTAQNIFNQVFKFKDSEENDFPNWEIKKLGDVCEIKRGASPRPISDSKWFDEESPIGWVRISDVTKSNKYLEKTEQYLSNAGVSKSRLVKKGNMIMSICATIGKPIYTNLDVCIHDGFVVFENLTLDKEFLYYYLDFIQLNWYKYGQPGIQVNLNSEIVNNESVVVPVIEEQIKIASFLSKFDEKINLETDMLTQYENQKKYLLQNLFV